MTGPKPVADLDEALRASLRDYHRTRWLGALAILTLLSAAVIVLGVLYVQQGARLRASCEFWRTLGALPVAVTKQAPQPSKLGVSIIAESRAAYAGQGCGRLPPADPSFARWARAYHLPAG
jgi:hypothetical protein